jgi:septal ring factor EnvC (AmiA/AmiB activator)
MEEPKSYSIIIVPSDHSGTRQFRVTRTVLILAAVLLTVATGVVVTFAGTHLNVLRTARRVTVVEIQNAQLREDVARIDELARELEHLSAQRAQIINMLGGEGLDETGLDLGPIAGTEVSPGVAALSDVERVQQLFADGARQSFAPRSWPADGPVRREFMPQAAEGISAHMGLTIDVLEGEAVRAAARGRVIESGLDANGVPILVLDHGYGFRTVYSGFARPLVSAGQMIEQQQPIAAFDLTSPEKRGGASQIDGAALYFEIRVDGIAIDPREYLTPRQGRRRGS